MSNNVGSVKSVFEIGGEALKLFPFLDEIILVVSYLFAWFACGTARSSMGIPPSLIIAVR
jgi:hypothetical protein